MLTRIVGLERRLMPIGKIRLGDQIDSSNGRKRPHVLEKVRLTSSNAFLLHEAAKLYGGVPRPWDDAPAGPRQWELYVEAEAIPILIPPIDALMQCYECWSAKGCLRRCNNETIQYAYDPKEVGEPCMCPADPEARQTLAAEGKACKLTTRISCMLPDLPGIGIWVIETHSYYASLWTAGMVEMLESMAKQGRVCEAMLRIERQSRKGKHGVRHFAIPTIMPHIMTPRQLFASEMRASLGLREPEEAQKPPISLDQPALLERAATAADDIFGDGASANMRAMPPVHALPPVREPAPRHSTVTPQGTTRTQGNPLFEENATLAIEVQITDLLYAQGRDDAAVAAWWEQQRTAYPDLSPGLLNALFEKLRQPGPPVDALAPNPRRRLAALQQRLGWTAKEQKAWENKQARRFKKSYDALPDETLTELVAELEAMQAPHEPEAMSVFLPPEEAVATPPEAAVPVSAFDLPAEAEDELALPGLAIPAALPSTEPRIFANIRDELSWLIRGLEDLMFKDEVEALIEDPDTPEDVLWAKCAEVQAHLEPPYDESNADDGNIPF